MADKRRTHKGQVIDIDMIRMKTELELKEINSINIKREKEVDTKRRRGSSERINEMLANQELIRQKLNKQKDDEEDETSETKTTETTPEAPAIVKETPETIGRKVVKRT